MHSSARLSALDEVKELFKQYVKNYEKYEKNPNKPFQPWEGIISEEEYKAALEKHSEEATRAPDKKDIGDFDDEEILSLGPGPNGLIGLRRGELIDREAGEVDGPPRLGYSEDSEEDEEEDESEKVQVLANFCYEGNKYVVATPLEPVLIIGL